MAPRRPRPGPAALGSFSATPKQYGFVPAVPRQRGGLPHTPALTGLFRAGPVVGVSLINLMATNVTRGSGA